MNPNITKLRGIDATVASIPLVAAAIGKANGVEVKFERSPQTNGKVIYLPHPSTLAKGLREDGRRVRALLWGFLDHEAAHVRFTDFNAIRRSLVTKELQALANVVEDIRIEGQMMERFPGAGINLREMCEILVETGWFAPAGEEASLIQRGTSYVLHQLRSQVLRQSALLPLALQDQAALPASTVAALEPLLAWQGVVTTEDAVTLAERILDVLKDEEEQQGRENAPETSDSNGDDTEPGEEQSGGDSQGEEEQKEQDSAPESTGSNGAESAPSDEKADGESGSTGGDDEPTDAGDADSSADAGKDSTQENGEGATQDGSDDQHEAANSQGSGSDNDTSPETASARPAVGRILENGGDLGDALATLLEERISGPSGRDVVEAGIASVHSAPRVLTDPLRMNRLGRQLTQSILEPLQTQTLVRERLGLRGSALDTRVLHRAALSDGRLFRARTVAKRPDTAIAFAMDLSGSMRERWDEAVTAALSALQGVSTIRGVKAGLFLFPHFTWAVPIGGAIPSTMRRGQLLEVTGFTPTAEALVSCGKALLERREPRKLLICSTDGEPDRPIDPEVAALKAVGIETLGIGIDTTARLPFDRWITIGKAEELRSVLGKTLRDIALG